LNGWILDASKAGGPSKQPLYDAIRLTETQRVAAETFLRAYWGTNDYQCPELLTIRLWHGFNSRVLKDGFSPWHLESWLIRGCDDAAMVDTDARGRPRLVLPGQRDFAPHVYDIVVPIRSDAHGDVSIDDVIPKGLPALRRR